MNPYYSDEWVTIYHGEALEVMADLAFNGEGPEFDLVALDPPYNVGKTYADHDDRMEATEYWRWLFQVFDLSRRLGPAMVYFPGQVNVLNAPWVLSEANWQVNRLLGWHKKEYAGDMFSAGPAMCWEPIIWARRGEQKPFYNRLFGAWGRDFLVVNSTHGNPLAKAHPCPKPLEVLRWLIGLFCPEGGAVLDPTMGTGTALVAAKYLHRTAVGIDKTEAYCELAAERLSQGILDFGESA